MDVKLFEVRDRGTFIPVMAVRLRSRTEGEHFLLRRSGYAAEQIISANIDGYEPYVILAKLDGVEAHYDPFSWPGRARTMPTAHQYIIANWDKHLSGDVIDVEFIAGETKEPKRSERLGETNIVRTLQETDRFIP